MSTENERERVQLGAAQQQQQGDPTELLPGDPGYAPPVASVPLPSLGKVYPADSPLHGRSALDVRAMTARDENILTSRPLLKKGTAIGSLIRACVLDKSVDPDEMLVGDRNAVLVALRVSAYGADYEVEVQCPSCERRFKNTFVLDRLPLRQLTVDPVEPGKNRFAFTLPVIKKEVIFGLMTGASERAARQAADEGRAKVSPGAPEENVTMALLHHVQRIGAVTDRTRLSRIIPALPAADSKALRRHIEKITPGVVMVQSITCPDPACGETSEVAVPMGTEFFWPE